MNLPDGNRIHALVKMSDALSLLVKKYTVALPFLFPFSQCTYNLAIKKELK